MTMSARLGDWVGRWWDGEAGAAGRVADTLLAPAEWLFRGVVRARNAGYDLGLLEVRRGTIPVISVGNLLVGGTGKTPFAAWLAGQLRSQGHAPAVVLRGYGSDEVLLHRELNPEITVVAGPQRARMVGKAAAQGCDVAVLDDAFQHRRIARDLDIVLVPAERWIVAPRLLPRGRFRESRGAMRRADLVVVTWKTEDVDPAPVRIALADRGHVTVGCRIAPAGLAPLHPSGAAAEPLESIRSESVLAVAALANPEPFRRNLVAAGARVELRRYPDHHPFTRSEADALAAAAAGRPLLMTHKDAVKLRPLLPPHVDAQVLRQEVSIAWGAEVLAGAVKAAVAGRPE